MTGKTLIIIACSNRKREGGIPGFRWVENDSAVSRLPQDSAKNLLSCRRTLAAIKPHPEGRDLGGIEQGSVPLMPAHRRYDGNLYRRISPFLWTKLPGKQSIEVVIVSALYGLLTPWEAIRKYDLAMDDTYKERYRLARWWRDHGLGKALVEYAERSGAVEVHNFLGGSYAYIAEELEDCTRREYKLQPHSYSGKGSGSDYYRGEDVRKLLEKALGKEP